MKNILDNALKLVDQAEVYKRDIYEASVSLKLNELKDISANKKTELALKVIKDNNMGSAVTTDINDDTLIKRAMIALENQKKEAIDLPNKELRMVFSKSKEVVDITTEEMVKIAYDINDRFKKKAEDIPFGVGINKTVKTVNLINSSGFDDSYDITNMSIYIYTLSDKGFMGASKEFSSGTLMEVKDSDLDELIQRHRLDKKPISLENEKMPVIFAGSVMGSLMLRVLGGVNGGNVVQGISPIEGKIGEKLFSDKITIRDDGKMNYGVNTMLFDDEGSPSQNTVLYEKGVLKNFLNTIATAKKLDMEPTGNAIKGTLFSKEIEDQATVMNTNFIVEGDMKEDDEIIKGIKRGILITGVMGSHTGNIVQGDFSMNISSGFLIEDGKLVGKVKGSMIAGNIYDLFNKIENIGTNYESMRGLFYNIGYSPMVQFSEMNVIGK